MPSATLSPAVKKGQAASDIPMRRRKKRRAEVLRRFGACAGEVEELLAYNENHFDHADLSERGFPLEDEPFVEAWQGYAKQAKKEGAFQCLKHQLVQLQFPVREGISETEFYRQATLRGKTHKDAQTRDEGVELRRPEALRIEVHPSLAGRVPLLITKCREDFTTLVRALTRKNEPAVVPDSMGASMVAGYNNWGRIRAHRRAWEERTDRPTEAKWQAEFKRLIPKKHLYQDRFILLSDGPYSSVPAGVLGLSEAEWRRKSLAIRREHECTHYFTKRALSSMRSNVLDELIADLMGIRAAAGQFRADWFLQFMGLEAFPTYRMGGRFENYCEGLSEGSFRALGRLVVAAAENVERFLCSEGRSLRGTLILLTLTQLTLEEMAAGSAEAHLERALMKAREWKAD